ncbi:hypothetical protein QQF64_019816, partial [Cirrhinus molitorella]
SVDPRIPESPEILRLCLPSPPSSQHTLTPLKYTTHDCKDEEDDDDDDDERRAILFLLPRRDSRKSRGRRF